MDIGEFRHGHKYRPTKQPVARKAHMQEEEQEDTKQIHAPGGGI